MLISAPLPHLPHLFRTTFSKVRKPLQRRSAAPPPIGVRGCGAVNVLRRRKPKSEPQISAPHFQGAEEIKEPSK